MPTCTEEQHSALQPTLPSFLQEEAGFTTMNQGDRSRSFPGTPEPEGAFLLHFHQEVTLIQCWITGGYALVEHR